MADIAQQKKSSYLLLIVLVICLIATLTTLSIFIKKDEIETDLTQRANRLLMVSGLLRGKVTFDGRDAHVDGRVALEKDKKRVLDIVKSVEGVRVVSGELAVSPIKTTQQNVEKAVQKTEKPKALEGRFTLRHDDGQWILVGTVDSETTKKNLIESTQEVIGEEISNLLKVDHSKPRPRWINKYLHVLEPFSYVYGGAELTLDKGILTIGGNVDSEAAMRMTLLPIRDTFGDIVSIRNTLRIVHFDGGIYQPEKTHDIEKIDLSDIKFDKENTEIKSVSSLNEVINIMKANTDLYIEIAGHANQSLNEDENIQISLARALLVKQYLVDNGIKKSHLRSYGYGSSRPIDKKDSSQNERIEVTVIREG